VDVAITSALEARFVSAVCRAAPSVLAVAPPADVASVNAWTDALEAVPQRLSAPSGNALARLQRRLFTPDEPLEAGAVFDESVELLSAPGEARECVELARRVMAHARAGVPFEAMAVGLRNPGLYRAPLEEALRRAGIPVHFAAATTRPDPAGRAFTSLLSCALEGLSAKRFAEYLSLGQVPRDDHGAPPPAWATDVIASIRGDELTLPDDKSPADAPPPPEPVEDDAPVIAGTLRAPRKWEAVLVEAAVIGGLDRWKRRLAGLRRARAKELELAELTDAQRSRAERMVGDVDALQAFALPVLTSLDTLPTTATWRVWLEVLASLATRVLRAPERVLALLSELAPLGDVGPVTLREVYAVVAPRLTELTQLPDTDAHGRLFVGPIDALRARAFDVVFVPGLAERLFPQKLREDPLLADDVRVKLSPALETNTTRVIRERALLNLAVGAARRAVVCSWPRLETEAARPRVPSFYVLDVMQSVDGQLPSFETVQRRAETAGGARLAWPAPLLSTSAIDDAEYDLSVLDSVLRGRLSAEGRAHYLVANHATLARALRARHQRWSSNRWTKNDGLIFASREEAAAVLNAHSLRSRAFAPTALEKFAGCPYRFVLSALHRFRPVRMPEAIEALGPLERGSLTHEVHYQLLSRLRDENVPVRTETLPRIFTALDEVLATVSAEFFDTYAPAIERVWLDGVETTRADVREWLRRTAADEGWQPWRFELSFGLGLRAQQDPASRAEPVTIDGATLRGSIDLVERSAEGRLRATDYKTGKARAEPGNVVGGGTQLQPALYALVLEQLEPQARIDSGRLSYCTQVGGFQTVTTPLDDVTRRAVKTVVQAIDGSFESGFFPAAPDSGECKWCDFVAVCGPDEERRVAKKLKSPPSRELLKPVLVVRALP
ncbi:MAG: PD-(D/E)XK nuclease family protein, partial [Archangium sp.]|nr:PD-(D/E)XK nuclease family protein [Archangium sp.]